MAENAREGQVVYGDAGLSLMYRQVGCIGRLGD